MFEPDPAPIRFLILAQDAAERAHKIANRINRRVKKTLKHGRQRPDWLGKDRKGSYPP
jgi:hypothetical protein